MRLGKERIARCPEKEYREIRIKSQVKLQYFLNMSRKRSKNKSITTKAKTG